MEFDNVIIGATRADALAAGALVDVTDTARKAGCAWPAAVTRKVYEDAIAWTDADSERTGAPQDEEGRRWDVVYMAVRCGSRAASRPGRYLFTLARVSRTARPTRDEYGDLTIEPEEITLHLVIGPGDDGRPALTIMQPDES